MNCGTCDIVISEGEDILCTSCDGNYHYLCQDISDTNYKKMSKTRLAAWKCAQCKSSQDNTIIHITNEDEQESKLGREMRALFEEFTTKLTAKIDEVKKSVEIMKTKISKMEKRQDKLEAENRELKENFDKMKIMTEEKIDFLENRSRISNIEIRGVPESPKEDIIKIVYEIGKKIGIQTLAEGDVQVAHRVDTKNDKERNKRPIIVHMGSRYLRNKWLEHFKKHIKSMSATTGKRGILSAKSISGTFPDTPIFLNEHITVQRKLLLKEAKEVAQKRNIKYVWIKDAFILMKQNDQAKHVQKINSKAELMEYQKKLQSSSFN